MITEKIKKIIEKNLSAEVGNTLKDVLRKAEKDSARVKELDKLLEHKNNLLAKEIAKNTSLNSKLIKEEEIIKREQVVVEKERNQEITILRIQLEESNKRADIIMNYTATLVKNSIIKKSIVKNSSSTGRIVNGEWEEGKNESNFTDETIKTE